MRQDLGKPAPVDLRRLFLSPGNYLQLRHPARRIHTREDCPTPSQHLALFRTPPPPPGLPSQLAGGFYAALERAAPRQRARRPQALHQKRRRLPAHAQFQGPRGRRGAGAGARVWLRYRFVLFDRQPRQLCRRTSCAQWLQGMDLHSRRSRARQDSRHPGLRGEGGAHRGQLRPGQSLVLADRR